MDFDVICSENLKMILVQAINNAIVHDVTLERSRRNYPYFNQPWVAMWNHMGANLVESLAGYNDITVLTAQRGPWSFVLIYLKTEKTVITIMSEDRLKDLQRKYRKRPIHYLDALIQYYNRDVESQQLTLDIPDLFQYRESDIEKILSKMCPQIKDDAKKHLLLAFDRKNDSLISITAKRLAAVDMTEVATEDWTQYIEISYETISDTGRVVQPANTEINVPLSSAALDLKKKKAEKQLDGAVEHKKEIKEDES